MSNPIQARVYNCWRSNVDGALICKPYDAGQIYSVKHGISSYTPIPDWVPSRMVGVYLRLHYGCLRYRD